MDERSWSVRGDGHSRSCSGNEMAKVCDGQRRDRLSCLAGDRGWGDCGCVGMDKDGSPDTAWDEHRWAWDAH